MPRQFEGINGVSSDFLKVLLKVKESTMKDIHVATLGLVTDIDSTNEIYKCTILPTLEGEQEKMISAYCVDSLSISVDDLVLILFLDKNFVQNLKQIRTNQKPTKIPTKSELHTESYGIIINKVKKSV